MQGVTTNIIGNCALSPAPVDDAVRLFFEQLLQHVFGTVNIREFPATVEGILKTWHPIELHFQGPMSSETADAPKHMASVTEARAADQDIQSGFRSHESQA